MGCWKCTQVLSLNLYPSGNSSFRSSNQIFCDYVFVHRLMGYKSPEHMLSQMSSSIRFIELPNGHTVVQGNLIILVVNSDHQQWCSIISALPDEKDSHIHQMVVKQKNGNNRVMKNMNSILGGNLHQNQYSRTNFSGNKFPGSKPSFQVVLYFHIVVYFLKICNLFLFSNLFRNLHNQLVTFKPNLRNQRIQHLTQLLLSAIWKTCFIPTLEVWKWG